MPDSVGAQQGRQEQEEERDMEGKQQQEQQSPPPPVGRWGRLTILEGELIDLLHRLDDLDLGLQVDLHPA